jgi:hypothetical protein
MIHDPATSLFDDPTSDQLSFCDSKLLTLHPYCI